MPLVEAPTSAPFSTRELFWLSNDAATPASLSADGRFIENLAPGSRVLDIGCGSGKFAHSFSQFGHQVHGVDINADEIARAEEAYPRPSFAVANAACLHYKSGSFDAVTAIGLLGGVERDVRRRIVAEACRVLRPGGYFYLAEFARITDPKLTTSKGRSWVTKYVEEAPLTGELGSFVVTPNGQEKSFIAHHFTGEELLALGADTGRLALSELCEVPVRSVISGEYRPGWRGWWCKMPYVKALCLG